MRQSGRARAAPYSTAARASEAAPTSAGVMSQTRYPSRKERRTSWFQRPCASGALFNCGASVGGRTNECRTDEPDTLSVSQRATNELVPAAVRERRPIQLRRERRRPHQRVQD
jgi:hypothetical protein